jgi:peptidoglycan-binding protein CsiV
MPRPDRQQGIRRRLARVLLICAAAALCGPGTASAAAAQYDVEVIVFRNLAPRNDGEQWPADTGGAAGGFTGIPIQEGVEELPESEFALNDVAGALQRSGAYQVLVHRRWRQNVYEGKSAVPYPLHATLAGARTLDGSVKLILEHYLHLDVDLTLASSGALYQLNEARRIRSGELHYFDNPYLGVIAKVTPYGSGEAPPEEPAGEGEPPSVPDEESDTVAEPPAQAR